MAGLEKILEEIEQKSNETVSQILKAAKDEANSILQAAEKESKTAVQAADYETEKKVAALKDQGSFAAGLRQRQKLLAVKQELISGVIEEALEKANNLPDAEYFEKILQMVKGMAHAEKGEILFNAKDKGRIPADFAGKLASAVPTGGSLTVSDTVANIKSGFILKYGDIEENGSFESIVNAHYAELQDKVRETLFG